MRSGHLIGSATDQKPEVSTYSGGQTRATRKDITSLDETSRLKLVQANCN